MPQEVVVAPDSEKPGMIAVMQWHNGMIYIGKHLDNAGDSLVLERLVSLQQMDEDNSFVLVPQPLPMTLISQNLDGCPHFIDQRNLAIYALFPEDSDHEIVRMYKKFWDPNVSLNQAL